VSSEDKKNKALARRFLEAFANGDLDTLDELLAPDFVNHSLLPGQDPGREGYIQMAAEKHAAFSDIRHTFDYQATDGDDMVITRQETLARYQTSRSYPLSAEGASPYGVS
jgi:ketosteroid isomerase-like protein